MTNPRGFTLIELFVALSLISLLVTMALPTYFNYLAKAQQSEAKSNLGAIYVGMMSYRAPAASNGFLGATLKNIGFVKENSARYTYTLAFIATKKFTALAKGIGGQVSGDVWEINQDRDLVDRDPHSFNR